MTQEEIIFAEIPADKFDSFTKEELIVLLRGEQTIRRHLEKQLKTSQALQEQLKQRTMLLEGQYCTIKGKLYGKSSEKSPRNIESVADAGDTKKKKKRVLLPSERYPDAPLIEQHITLDQPPSCGCCESQMVDSGMTEDSEFLTVIPEQYLVVRQLRHKYRCNKCYGDLKTAPLPPRIKEASSYSDEMIIDVAMTKYCDLIPIERYSNIAARGGLKGLPPQSLIDSTHNLANFVRPAYELLKGEILAAKILHADETPHRMLEGDKKCSWFLWGFSTKNTSYFECHDTRSGDVAKNLLASANCDELVSDVYSGYSKAVREANELRKNESRELINHVFCNAHSRRYFRQSQDQFSDEAQFFIDQYTEIYKLEDQAKSKSSDEILNLRSQMRPYFEAIKEYSMCNYSHYSAKSSLGKAMNYYLKNYQGLTRFLDNAELPIDNNPQERLLRNPVIGRKTWYGTHSKQGAETAAILFSLVESCKLNKLNPREYFKELVATLHNGKPAFTPKNLKNPVH